MVHVTELGADYFQYDETRHELRGERTGIRYQLTDRVTVQVSRVDLDARKIDLRLVSEPGIHTQLKNEARRAESEQGGKSRKRSSKQEPAPAAELGQEQAATAERKRRSGESATVGAVMPGSGARVSRRSAGDKQNGGRKKRQK
jgi:ribonuclease R